MNLTAKIENNLKQAMLSRNKELADLLRLVKSAFKNEMINLKVDNLTDEQAFKILKSETKKRKDSIEQFTKGGRADLAKIEERELKLLQPYLPEEMGQDELKQIIEKVIQEMGEVTPSQFGKVMSTVMAQTQGKADGSIVSQLVKQALK